MATSPPIPPVLGAATRAFLTKLGPVLKQAVNGANNDQIIETGVVVANEWKFVQLGTAAEIRNVLSELRMA